MSLRRSLLQVACFSVGVLALRSWIGSAQAGGTFYSESSLCADSDWVFVATVKELEVFKKQSGYHATKATLAIDAVVHGDPPPIVEIVYNGGTLDGVSSYASGAPQLSDQKRYLLFTTVRQLVVGAEGKSKFSSVEISDNRRGPDIGFNVRLLKWVQLSAEAPLPTELEMKSLWYEHCSESLGLPQSAGAGLRPAPTVKYLEFIPQALLDWCEHY